MELLRAVNTYTRVQSELIKYNNTAREAEINKFINENDSEPQRQVIKIWKKR